MINIIWAVLFLISVASALCQLLFSGNVEIFSQLIKSIFDMAKLSVEVSIGLVGAMAMWLGMFNIAEKSGIIRIVSHALSPLFYKMMPDIPKDHPAIGSITMSISANILGIDNAVTPLGIKAMQDMQTLNKHKDTATDAQVLFSVICASCINIIPITIMMYRAQMGSTRPAEILIPIILATTASMIAAITAAGFWQKIDLFNRVVALYVAILFGFIGLIVFILSVLPSERHSLYSTLFANISILSCMTTFIIVGLKKKVNVYEVFVEGAKSGFDISIKIIPYLVAMFMIVGLLRDSGIMGYLIEFFTFLFNKIGINTDFIPALPVAFMRSFSGSGSRALMLEVMGTYGADSFPSVVASVIQGSSETTFYILTVYMGAVGIRKIRHGLICGLIADVVGVVTAILVSYWLFY